MVLRDRWQYILLVALSHFMEQDASSAEHSVQTVAVVLAPSAVCIQKMVLWEPTPVLIADCDTPQIHYLCANMIQCLTYDLVLWLTPSYKSLHSRERQGTLWDALFLIFVWSSQTTQTLSAESQDTMGLIQPSLKTGLSLSINSNESKIRLSISTHFSGGLESRHFVASNHPKLTSGMENKIFFFFFLIKVSTRPGCLFLTKLIYMACCAELRLLLTVTWLWGGILNCLWPSRLPYIMQNWGWGLFCFSHTPGRSVFDCFSNDRYSSYSLIYVDTWAVKTLMHSCLCSCSFPADCPGHLTFCLCFWCEIWTNLCAL